MVWKQLNNAQACKSWLEYLQTSCGATPLLGDLQEVHAMAQLYAKGVAPGSMLNYFAECPLLGKPGVDLSVQYPLKDFVKGNVLVDTQFAGQGKVFMQYAYELGKVNPAALDICYVYLEADTSLGKADESAVFINLAGNTVPLLLPQVFAWEGETERLHAVERYLAKVAGYFEPWHFGFMASRKEKPLRLTLRVVDDSMEKLLQGLRILGFATFLAEKTAFLEQLDKIGLFNYMVDFDVMPDGSLGSTVGVELNAKNVYPVLQKSMLASDDFVKLTKYFQENGLADARMELVPRCVWYMDAPDTLQDPYYMYSFLSHFKLRWQGTEPMPAKIYLQMRTVDKQWNLNETLQLVGRHYQ